MTDGSTYTPLSLQMPRPEDIMSDAEVERILSDLPGMIGMMSAARLRRHMMAAERAAYDAGKAASHATGQPH